MSGLCLDCQSYDCRCDEDPILYEETSPDGRRVPSLASRHNVTCQPSAEVARVLHRVVRAMHDGHCPVCGCLRPSEDFYTRPVAFWDSKSSQTVDRQEGFHKCPECGFTVTDGEARDALAAFKPFLEENMRVYKEWAAKRAYDKATICCPYPALENPPIVIDSEEKLIEHFGKPGHDERCPKEFLRQRADELVRRIFAGMGVVRIEPRQEFSQVASVAQGEA